MTTRRIALVTALVLALPAGAAGQVGEGRPGGRTPPSAEQREEMRQRVETRFLDIAAERLELDANQRTRLGTLMEHTAEERRSIAEDGMRLRREAADLLRADSRDDARAQHILSELTRLREREVELWRREQQDLAGVLTAPQRLELMALRARFMERVQDVRGGRGGPAGPGMRPPRGEGLRDGPGMGPRGMAPVTPPRGRVPDAPQRGLAPATPQR